MNHHTSDRPMRISPILRNDIENVNNTRFQGKLPFARASEVYVEEKRRLEETIVRLQKALDNKNNRRGGLL